MYKRQKRVSAPVASSSVVRFEAADRAISLVGREYVGLVSAQLPAGVGSTSTFSTTFGLLRPTDTQLFSWMSAIASKFEKYKFNKLCFVYEPQCPTSTSGSVAMWFDPDPTHTVPADWNNMINTGVNTHGAPWTSHVLNVPLHLCAGRRQYYTKSEFADANINSSVVVGFQPAPPTDPLEYFAGMYGFATQDIGPGVVASTTVPVGKVYLDYAITLKTQATNTWNLTSMIKAVPVAAEPASNSGSGLLMKAPYTWPTQAGVYSYVDIIGHGQNAAPGNVPPPIPFQVGGNKYWNQNATTNIATIINNIDCCLSVGCRTVAGNLVLMRLRVVRGPNSDVAPGTSYQIDATAAGQAAAVSGVYAPWYMIPSAMAAQAVLWVGYLRLYAGDQLNFEVDTGGNMQLSDCSVQVLPCPFGLSQ